MSAEKILGSNPTETPISEILGGYSYEIGINDEFHSDLTRLSELALNVQEDLVRQEVTGKYLCGSEPCNENDKGEGKTKNCFPCRGIRIATTLSLVKDGKTHYPLEL